MKRIIFIGGILLTYITTYAQVPATVTLRDSARIFGKNAISAGDFVFNASFTADDQTVYFSKATINWAYIAIFYSTKTASGWSNPQAVNFTGTYRDTDPFVSADGKRLYFTSDRPIDNKPFKDYGYNYYYVELSGNRIVSKPKLFSLPVASGAMPTYLSFADNGNAYFHLSDGTTDADLYVCRLKNGSYLPPERLPFNDKKYIDFDAVVAHDESFIIFCSNNRKGSGSADLWVSFKKDTTWTEPVNLGPKVNTRGSDGAPGLSRDDKTLYFASYKETPDRPDYSGGKITADAINNLMHSTQNGIRTIYEIDISDLKGP